MEKAFAIGPSDMVSWKGIFRSAKKQRTEQRTRRGNPMTSKHKFRCERTADTIFVSDGILLNKRKTRKQRRSRRTFAPGRFSKPSESSDTVTTTTSNQFHASNTNSTTRVAKRLIASSHAKREVKKRSMVSNTRRVPGVSLICASQMFATKFATIRAATNIWVMSAT